MQGIFARLLHRTTSQVNLLDLQNRAVETNLNMSFYDGFSGLLRYDFYHTLNPRGFPDTLFLDPVNTYDIKVHSIPPVIIEGVELKPGVHNQIDISVPQGFLKLEVQGILSFTGVREKIKCLVRIKGDSETIFVQDFNSSQKYLVGVYDLEILTLPRLYKKGVKIDQSSITSIQIPAPGLVSIHKSSVGTGAIFQLVDNRMKKIHQLKQSGIKEFVALQPGYYRAVFKTKNAKK